MLKSRLAKKVLLILLFITIIPSLLIFIYSINGINTTITKINDINKKSNNIIVKKLEEKLLKIAENNLKQIIYEKKKYIDNIFTNIISIINLQENALFLNYNIYNNQIFFERDYLKRNSKLHLIFSKKHNKYISLDNYVIKLAPNIDFKEYEKDIRGYYNSVNILKNVYKNNPLIFWQYTGFENGYHMSYPGHSGYGNDYDPRKRDWYKKAKEKKSIYWQEPYIDITTKKLLIACCKPIYRKEKFVGVTAIDIDIDSIKEHLLKVDTFKNINIYIINEDGKVLIKNSNLNIDYIKNKDILSDLINHKNGFRKLKVKNKDIYFVYSKLLNIDWYIMIILPKTEITNFISEIKISMNKSFSSSKSKTQKEILKIKKSYTIFFILIFILTIFIATIISKYLLKPINELTIAATRIAKGDFDFQLKSLSKDEIGYLMESFNKMIIDLKEREKLKRENIAYEQELSIGQEMQHSLLPTNIPKYKTLEVSAELIPAREIGGDLYNFIDFSDNRKGIVIGDVAGKGIHAGLFMAMTSAILKSINSISSPEKILSIVNNTIIDYFEDDSPSHVTVCYVTVDEENKKFIIANAGHEYPIYYNKKDNSIEYLKINGTPIGMFYNDNDNNDKIEINYSKGDMLLLYTDGFTECTNIDGQEYGRNEFLNFVKSISHLSTENMIKEIFKEMKRFENGAEPSDDKAIIVIKPL